MNNNLFVTAKFEVKKDKLDNALALMKNLTEATKQNEAGCINYYYLQNITNPCEFTSYEIWKNEEEELKHWNTIHVQKALKDMPDLLVSFPEILKWNSIV